MIDKIVQIVKGDERYSIHGISERGNLYFIGSDESGNQTWKFICKSPKISNTKKGGNHADQN